MVQWQWWQERVRNIRSLLSALLRLPSPHQSCNAHLVIHRHYVSSTPGLHSVRLQSHFRGRRCRVQASKCSAGDYSAQIYAFKYMHSIQWSPAPWSCCIAYVQIPRVQWYCTIEYPFWIPLQICVFIGPRYTCQVLPGVLSMGPVSGLRMSVC